jgi:hypothetical protein
MKCLSIVTLFLISFGSLTAGFVEVSFSQTLLAALEWQRRIYRGKAQCFLADVKFFALKELTRHMLWMVYKYLQGLANHVKGF